MVQHGEGNTDIYWQPINLFEPNIHLKTELRAVT